MAYFSRRNNLITEFSGHEEVSWQLRKRLSAVIGKYVGRNAINYSDNLPWNVETKEFIHKINNELLKNNPDDIIINGEYHEAFTVLEIFLEMIQNIRSGRSREAFIEILKAFNLSGSVYTVDRNYTVILQVSEDLAEKIENTKEIFSPYENAYKLFFEAVGNLVNRKANPKDVLKDLFVATESYLKQATNKSRFGDSVTKLLNDGIIDRNKKGVLDKLNAFASDAFGVRHAGSSPIPGEADALWFLETVIPQLKYIDNKLK